MSQWHINLVSYIIDNKAETSQLDVICPVLQLPSIRFCFSFPYAEVYIPSTPQKISTENSYVSFISVCKVGIWKPNSFGYRFIKVSARLGKSGLLCLACSVYCFH